MRQIGEIPATECKITLFSWNNKYLIKYEVPGFEQTYKIDESDIAGEHEIRQMAVGFLKDKTLDRFDAMRDELDEALNTL